MRPLASLQKKKPRAVRTQRLPWAILFHAFQREDYEQILVTCYNFGVTPRLYMMNE